jgi:hypothetical protein
MYWEQQNEFHGGYTKALFLWKNIEPLYQKLHAFVSKQLSRHYTFLRSTNNTLIPAYLLGRIYNLISLRPTLEVCKGSQLT